MTKIESRPPVELVIESWNIRVTFAENIFLMMAREEGAEVITYCKMNDVSYKTRLAELDIPAWKFYDSKSRYALGQEFSEAKGEFLQLYASESSMVRGKTLCLG